MIVRCTLSDHSKSHAQIRLLEFASDVQLTGARTNDRNGALPLIRDNLRIFLLSKLLSLMPQAGFGQKRPFAHEGSARSFSPS